MGPWRFIRSIALLSLALAGGAAPAAAAGVPEQVPNRRVCPGPLLGAAACHARVVTDRRGTPLAGSGPSGYGPAQFHGAYELPNATAAAQTIAIVDAYDDPTIESDLAVYSTTYGLPACTTANGCFSKVNQSGEEGSYPKEEGGWALEIALDVETAHAICQNCKILLVEASSAFFSDLSAAVNTAAALGATQISNSYGGGEYAGETSDTTYDHPGIAITVSAGDNGYAAEYPAASPYVVAVGGTTLTLGPSDSYGSETVWSGSGSGCSAYASAPSWQPLDPSWALTGCGTKRGIADVAADADPSSGAAVYDTTKYKGQSGWFTVGGTSLSAPLVAGVFALAANGSGSYPAAQLYAHESDSPASLHDVTSGSNGSCGTIMCKGVAGYDGPTGVGTPKGLAAFGQAPPGPHLLTVAKTGEGTVASSPGGIVCGTECEASFEDGTEVTLTASAAAGYVFRSWGHCDNGGVHGRRCTVTMSAAKSVSARFARTYDLTVSKAGGSGLGTVSSRPAGIACAANCSTATAAFVEGTGVELVPTPLTHFHFVEWGGDCSGAASCSVSMTKGHAIEATFAEDPKQTLTLIKAGSGQGTVASKPAGVACGNTCSTLGAGFYEGVEVVLSEVPGNGSAFGGWSGCDGVDGEGHCVVKMNAGKEITAEFK